jgi:hypothetical protein
MNYLVVSGEKETCSSVSPGNIQNPCRISKIYIYIYIYIYILHTFIKFECMEIIRRLLIFNT